MPDENKTTEETEEEYVSKEEHEKTQRELAFLKAGIDTNSPMAQYFVQGYSGELDPESIKEEATKVGLVSGEEEEEKTTENNNPDLTQEEKDQATNRRNLSTGALPDDNEGESPYAAARRTHKETIDAGASKDDALAAGIGKIFDAALNGDERVMYRP